MNARAVMVPSSDLRLEGRLAVPDTPRGAAVLCHPHPRYEGSMSSILIPLIQRALARIGWASLRFNFRGVGRSEGRFDRGVGEVRDVSAALDYVSDAVPAVPLASIGWSFGAMAALAGAAGDPRVETYVAVAPPVTSKSLDLPAFPPPEKLASWNARMLAICGSDDPLCEEDATAAWASSVRSDAEVRVIDGADHFFTGHREELLDLIVGFVER